MYCPNCAQQHVSDEVQYCSRCGLSLPDLRELSGGQPKRKETSHETLTPRQKGMRLGAMLMALSVILIPAYILLAALFPANDRLIESAVSDTPFEKISQAFLFTIFILGVVRLLYARFFQSGVADETTAAPGRLEASANYSLPPAVDQPLTGFGTWRETGEIVKSD